MDLFVLGDKGGGLRDIHAGDASFDSLEIEMSGSHAICIQMDVRRRVSADHGKRLTQAVAAPPKQKQSLRLLIPARDEPHKLAEKHPSWMG
ncbi:MAG: hypothetical protein QM703_13335 [Gemmatales bacterium]